MMKKIEKRVTLKKLLLIRENYKRTNKHNSYRFLVCFIDYDLS